MLCKLWILPTGCQDLLADCQKDYVYYSPRIATHDVAAEKGLFDQLFAG
jgi:hypothetical protein